MSNTMYDNITGRSPIATDDLGYIGTGQKASQILSGGTTDYDELTNKPSINSVELSGNKTSSDLGLQPELTEAQTNAVNSGITAELTEQIITNQNNISLIKHAANTSIYIQETQPESGNKGDYWISTTGTKIYHFSNNLFDGELLQGVWATVSTRTQTDSAAFRSFKLNLPAGTYTISFAVAVNIVRVIKDGTLIQNVGNNITSHTVTTTTENDLGFSFRITGTEQTPWDNSNIMLNSGETPLPYEPYDEYSGQWV